MGVSCFKIANGLEGGRFESDLLVYLHIEGEHK